jgi:lambda family phage portal protein
VVAGAFAIFIRMDPDAFNDLFSEDTNLKTDYLKRATNWDGRSTSTLEGPGNAVNLVPGESVDSVNPGRPNDSFDPFVQAILRQAGAALELPFEVLVKHYTASYSAARAALLDAWRFFRGRRAWLASYFCQPIYELWLAEAVALGRIRAPGFFADPAIRKAYCGAEWVGDGPGSIDPLKEVDAAERRIQIGTSTLAAESVLHDGGDWESKHRQRAREQAARTAAGLVADPAAPPAPAPVDPDA